MSDTHGAGHNSVRADDLKAYVDRLERLQNDRENVATDIKEVYSELKSKGYDTRTVRELIKLRKLDASDREEREALLQTYADAVGF